MGLPHPRECPDRAAAWRDLLAYTEGNYNRQPVHSAIGYSHRRVLADAHPARTGAENIVLA
jgi:hypothetical protein